MIILKYKSLLEKPENNFYRKQHLVQVVTNKSHPLKFFRMAFITFFYAFIFFSFHHNWIALAHNDFFVSLFYFLQQVFLQEKSGTQMKDSRMMPLKRNLSLQT